MVATVVLVLLSWTWTAPTAVVADPIMWSGGITSSSAAIRVHIDGGTDTLYVATSTEQLSATGAVWQATLHGPGVAAAAVTGLSTDTQYFYAVASATSLVGKFRTLPQEGSAANFTVAFASCACTGYDSPVFDDIAALQPAMFLHMGDLHYANIDTNSVEVRNQSFYDVFASPTQVRCCEPPPLGCCTLSACSQPTHDDDVLSGVASCFRHTRPACSAPCQSPICGTTTTLGPTTLAAPLLARRLRALPISSLCRTTLSRQALATCHCNKHLLLGESGSCSPTLGSTTTQQQA